MLARFILTDHFIPVHAQLGPRLAAIILTVPIIVWFFIRWNKWLRLLALLMVGLSTVISINSIADAVGSRSLFLADGPDYFFLFLAFTAGALPIVVARLAFVVPKKKPNQALLPTPTAVTPPAVQEPRQP